MNYSFYGEPDGPHTTDYYFWVLRQGTEVVVVDTGYSKLEADKRGRAVLIDPITAMRELGIDPEAGHPVVVTHAHYDHIGNLEAFSNSPVHIAHEEVEFWTSDLADMRLFAHYGDGSTRRALAAADADGRLHAFDGAVDIAPGVRAYTVGGHTPGQAIVSVETSIGTVLLASDAVHFHEEIERDMLFESMTDLPSAFRAFATIRELAPALIVSGHDDSELDRHTPLGGALDGFAVTIGELDA